MEEKHFIDWYYNIFPYGYGTGDEHYINALHGFFTNLEDDRSYSHEVLEEKIGKEATWFLINILCKEGIIEYGTSPRFAWIQSEYDGVANLRDFIASKTPEELYEMVMVSEEYSYCYPTHCNCDEPCNNPLWK